MDITEVIEDLEKISSFELGSYVIRYKGLAIRLANGKCLWKQPGHAKSALTNHIATIYHGYRYPYTKINDMGFKNAKELSHYLVEQGILKVEKL